MLNKLLRVGEGRMVKRLDAIASHVETLEDEIASLSDDELQAKTGEFKLFEVPTSGSAPRRGQMDSQDRLWFAQYRGDRVAMFDTKTEEFKEWRIPPRWSAPYDAVLDKNDEVWTGSMLSDQVTRLNTKTNEMVQYLLPRTTNIRRVFVDNTTTPVTFWVGSNHGHSIVKVEPLD